jgi:hypothetical protein
MAETISGAAVKLYIGGILYPNVRSISLTIDYGQEPIYGIDSFLPQEIKQTRVSVQGSISGVRIRTTSGLQGANIVKILKEQLQSPYLSVEIRDRISNEVMYFIQGVKVTNETFRASVKGTAELSFNFKGIMPYQPFDMQYS